MSKLSDQRILVVDDHQVIRAGLTSLLSSEGWIETAEAGSLRSAKESISKFHFSHIITDQHLGDGEGLALAEFAREKNPQVRLALFTFEESWALIERARVLGFSLFISKSSTLSTIISALGNTSEGINSFSIHAPSLPRESTLVSPLTKSEIEVLSLLSHGLTAREIAARRYNSEATIKSHVAAILRKLQSRNRVEAIAKARSLRLIPTT